MASLELSDFTVDKNRLYFYFDKFQFKISLKLLGIEYFRYINNLDGFYARLGSEISISDFRSLSLKNRFNISTLDEMLSQRFNYSKLAIEEFIKWKQNKSEKKDHIIKISRGYIDIYTSNLEIIRAFKNIADRNSIHCRLYYVESNEYERNVIYLKNPKNDFRLYFGFNRMDNDLRDRFLSILNSNPFVISKSLLRTLNNETRTIQRYIFGHQSPKFYLLFDHHYVDFDDERLVTILSLACPDFIRKICRIEKR